MTLLGLAVVVLGFVPYALFATHAPAVRAQARLGREISRTLTRTSPTPVQGGETGGRSRPGTGEQAPVAVVSWPAVVPTGTPLARLSIPAAGVRGDVVVQGVDELQLEEGPGHYPGTPLPGQPGNVAIAGHRTTWLHPFYNLQEVRPGDPIVLAVAGRRWVYTTRWVRTVSPSDVSVVDPARGWLLTLTTCTPRFSAAERLVLRAALDVGATRALAAKTLSRTRRITVTRVTVTRLASARAVVSSTPTWVLAAWAAGVATLALLASIFTRRTRTSLLLLVPAAVCCYEAYGAAVRLLPASW